MTAPLSGFEPRRSIERDQGIPGSRPLICRAAAVLANEIAQCASAANSGQELRYVDGIAPVQFLVIDLLAGDSALDGAGLGLESFIAGGDFHGLCRAADGERCIY